MILSLGMMELYAEIIVEELYDVYEEEKDKLLYRWCGRARAILCFHTRTRLNDRALISICLTMCGWKLAGGWRALKATVSSDVTYLCICSKSRAFLVESYVGIVETT